MVVQSKTYAKNLSLVAYLDVYGFSALVESTSRKKDILSDDESEFLEIELRLQSCVEQIRDMANLMELDFFGISDCIFLVCPIDLSTPKLAMRTLGAAKAAISSSITIFNDCGFDVRGGVAIGHVLVRSGSILIGKPVIRAARLEQSFNAPLVYLPLKELAQINEHAANAVQIVFGETASVVKNSESGKMKVYILTVNNIVALINSYKNKYEHHLVEGPPNVAAAYEEAIAILFNITKNTN